MIFEAGQKVLFIGDSITDCGRIDEDPPYGNGYMSLVRAFVTARRPELGLTWVNHGIGGNTVRDLAARWDADVIREQPDWLSVMIGINDVWRLFTPGQEADAVPIEEFETTLRALLRQAVEATSCRLILADPYVIEPDRSEPQRALSDQYGQVVAALSQEFGALHVPTQAAYDRALTSTKALDWADDRIHPNLPGHAVLAEAFLEVIG